MSTLALNFFATAPTTTIDNSDIIERQATPWNAGRFDNMMMFVLILVIGFVGGKSLSEIDSASVQNGIESFSHYHE